MSLRIKVIKIHALDCPADRNLPDRAMSMTRMGLGGGVGVGGFFDKNGNRRSSERGGRLWFVLVCPFQCCDAKAIVESRSIEEAVQSAINHHRRGNPK